jgi:hypothetical protein
MDEPRKHYIREVREARHKNQAVYDFTHTKCSE